MRTFDICSISIITSFLLSGCAQQIFSYGRAPLSPDIFSKTESIEHTREACLRPGIVFSLMVEVNGKNEIETLDLRVNDNGKAMLPIIGAVEVSQWTLTEASKRLSSLYSRYYTDPPLVRVQFTSEQKDGASPWGYVTVLGRVAKPGRVILPATRDLTVSAAIQGAGGLDTSANQTSIRITRIGTDLKKYQTMVDLSQIGSGRATQLDVSLQAGDVVFVPERLF